MIVPRFVLIAVQYWLLSNFSPSSYLLLYHTLYEKLLVDSSTPIYPPQNLKKKKHVYFLICLYMSHNTHPTKYHLHYNSPFGTSSGRTRSPRLNSHSSSLSDQSRAYIYTHAHERQCYRVTSVYRDTCCPWHCCLFHTTAALTSACSSSADITLSLFLSLSPSPAFNPTTLIITY